MFINILTIHISSSCKYRLPEHTVFQYFNYSFSLYTYLIFIRAEGMDKILCFKNNNERREQVRRSKVIDQDLLQEKVEYYKTIRILLLGASECGKSTFLKQMRILHGQDYDVQDLLEFRPIIYGNIIRIVKVLVTARQSLDIQWTQSSLQSYADQILSFKTKANEIQTHEFQAMAGIIQEIWLDGAIQETYRRRNEFILVIKIALIL